MYQSESTLFLLSLYALSQLSLSPYSLSTLSPLFTLSTISTLYSPSLLSFSTLSLPLLSLLSYLVHCCGRIYGRGVCKKCLCSFNFQQVWNNHGTWGFQTWFNNASNHGNAHSVVMDKSELTQPDFGHPTGLNLSFTFIFLS